MEQFLNKKLVPSIIFTELWEGKIWEMLKLINGSFIKIYFNHSSNLFTLFDVKIFFNHKLLDTQKGMVHSPISPQNYPFVLSWK